MVELEEVIGFTKSKTTVLVLQKVYVKAKK